MRLAWSAIYLVVLSGAVIAQSDRGAITGTISDPAGAVIANASVQGRNVETGGI